MTQALQDLRFRSHPLVELKPLASLSDAQREAFRDLESDPGTYGLFVPKPPLTMTLKSAARQTADLFCSLARPARIDAAFLGDGEDVSDIVDLVLDGILEIESGDGFVSGADAISPLGIAVPEGGGARSRAALLHAQEIESNDPQTLAMALYRYNHIPITPFWKARFAGCEAILAHLGADRGALRAMLDRDWTLSRDDGAWMAWTSALAPFPSNIDAPIFKLYISPRPERIRDAFEALVRVLAAVPASFKMGSGAAGLLRPDKLVVYFAAREELDEASSMICRELAGCDAHGVPFTAALDDSGLLSWGMDPPESERALRWLGPESWRVWIAQRLGGAMAVARAARTERAVEAWRFAIARLQRLGVDVDTWTPSPALWRAP